MTVEDESQEVLIVITKVEKIKRGLQVPRLQVEPKLPYQVKVKGSMGLTGYGGKNQRSSKDSFGSDLQPITWVTQTGLKENIRQKVKRFPIAEALLLTALRTYGICHPMGAGVRGWRRKVKF